MKPIAIVTGAGTGIGRALVLELARNRNLTVLGVGRRLQKLQETAIYYPERIKVVAADISTNEGRQRILKAIPEDTAVNYLVHNAGVLTPVKPLAQITLEEWRQHMAINVEGPLFLTQLLLPKLRRGRILHISSGAAHNPYEGWGAYCTSKAALYMIYQVLREELKTSGIQIGSVRPGVVDTPMQDQVRLASEEVFPNLQKFISLKENNQLIHPKDVAELLTKLLLDTSDEEFSAEEWDLRDNPPK